MLFCALALAPAQSVAQGKWASPETAEMYRQAQEYMAMKNYHEAAIAYKHVLLREPGNGMIYEALGKAQHLEGNDKDAEETLLAAPENAQHDAAYFEILAIVQATQNNKKATHFFPVPACCMTRLQRSRSRGVTPGMPSGIGYRELKLILYMCHHTTVPHVCTFVPAMCFGD